MVYDEGYIDEEEFREFRERVFKVIRMLNGYISVSRGERVIQDSVNLLSSLADFPTYLLNPLTLYL